MTEPGGTDQARTTGTSGTTGVVEVVGFVRAGHRVEDLRSRVHPGDVVVLDQPDLGPEAATELVGLEVAAVLNVAPMRAARSSGATVLLQAGVALVDRIAAGELAALADGTAVRLRGSRLLLGDHEVARGRVVVPAVAGPAGPEGPAAGSRLAERLSTSPGVHEPRPSLSNGEVEPDRDVELVRHGTGLPVLGTSVGDRRVVVLARVGTDPVPAEVVRRSARGPDPVVVAVGRAADDAAAAGLGPQVVVVSASDPGGVPGLEVLRGATDLVVRTSTGETPAMLASLTELGLAPVVCRTQVAVNDLALLLARAGDPALVVGVGVTAAPEDPPDPHQVALAALVRWRMGSVLVDHGALAGLEPDRRGPRRRAVAATAVAALLAGVVLGGPLQAVLGSSDPTDGATGAAARLEGPQDPSDGPAPDQAGGAQDSRASQETGRTTYAEALAAASGARAYAGGLSDTPVAMLALPGSDPAGLKALSAQVQAAGGRITGRFGLRESALDPSATAQVQAETARWAGLAPQAAADPSPHVRLGALLGAGLASPQAASAPPTPAVLELRAGLDSAGLVSSPAVPVVGAPLVLVVLGPTGGAGGEESAELAAEVVAGLTAGAAGVVVVGSPGTGGSPELAAVRARAGAGAAAPGVLATVDGGLGEQGRLTEVSAVLALIGARQGRGGDFGPTGRPGSVPLQ